MGSQDALAGVGDVVKCERYSVALDQPVDRRTRRARHRERHSAICFATRLSEYLVGEKTRTVVDAALTLNVGAGGRDLATRDAGTASWRALTFEDRNLDASLACSECCAKSAGAGADDEHWHPAFERKTTDATNGHALSIGTRGPGKKT
jgi:hypothetical protein